MLYQGEREKYRDVLGTVWQVFSDSFFVVFDDNDSGIFSHHADFIEAPAVDRLGQLAED